MTQSNEVPWTSLVVAQQEGIAVNYLYFLLRTRKVTPPRKTSGGDYLWYAEDRERVQAYLRGRKPRKAAASGS